MSLRFGAKNILLFWAMIARIGTWRGGSDRDRTWVATSPGGITQWLSFVLERIPWTKQFQAKIGARHVVKRQIARRILWVYFEPVRTGHSEMGVQDTEQGQGGRERGKD